MSMEREAVKEQNKSTTRHKVLTAVGIVLCVILIPILVINVTMIVKSYINPDEYPSFAGINLMIVKSPSMEPAIMNGDLIIVNSVSPEEIKGESVPGASDGDIISFFDPEGSGTTVLTHRCVEAINEGGQLYFKTRGDANNTEDPTLVPAENIIGRFSTRIPVAGDIAMWLQTTPGLIICVAVPIILLIAYDLIMKKRYDKKKKSDTDALLAELDALRARQAAAEADKSSDSSED